MAGCGAHRPLQGIPVSQVPEEWRHPITYRSHRDTIDLSLLRQTTPADHYVDAGDVLGIYIEGVLGGDGQVPPVYIPQSTDLPPSMGYPVAVRGDGTISLPGYDAVNVRGLTLRQVEGRIRSVCSGGDQPLLVQGNERIIVSLQRPRVARVLVIRQESGNEGGHGPQHGDNSTNRQKRGTGRVVALPAYRNDVLNALAETGGLPGVDAENVIYVIRGSQGRQPVVAPPPAPAERSVHHNDAIRHWPAGPDRSHAETRIGPSPVTPVAATASGIGRSGIQLAGGLVDDPFLQNPDDSTPAAGPAGPLLNEPERALSDAREQATNAPVQSIPGLKPSLPAAGHSTVDERYQAQFDEFGTHGPLPPVPVDDEQPASAAADRRAVPLAPPSPPLENLWNEFGWTAAVAFEDPTIAGSRVVRIPLKLLPGEVPHFREEDIILHDGDVVFVETREQDFFRTGGLLGGGQYPLPRDYDITVIDAIAIAEQAGANSPLPTRALGGVSALNQDVTVGASQVIVLRRLPDGCEVPIEVDLHEAIRHPDQRIIIQAGDRIILQYTGLEAIGAFFERHILDGAIIGLSSAAVFSN